MSFVFLLFVLTEYCYYMGKYFRPYQEFENADNVNVCFCTVNLEIKCSEELSTYGDMCFYWVSYTITI